MRWRFTVLTYNRGQWLNQFKNVKNLGSLFGCTFWVSYSSKSFWSEPLTTAFTSLSWLRWFSILEASLERWARCASDSDANVPPILDDSWCIWIIFAGWPGGDWTAGTGGWLSLSSVDSSVIEEVELKRGESGTDEGYGKPGSLLLSLPMKKWFWGCLVRVSEQNAMPRGCRETGIKQTKTSWVRSFYYACQVQIQTTRNTVHSSTHSQHFFRLKESFQVENLPCPRCNQHQNRKETEPLHAFIRGFCYRH